MIIVSSLHLTSIFTDSPYVEYVTITILVLGGGFMEVLAVIVALTCIVVIFSIITIEVRLKRKLENDERIIGRLDELIRLEKERSTR